MKIVFSVQHVLGLFIFLGIMITMAIRVNISIVLTQMVYIPNAHQNSDTQNNSTSNDQIVCPIKYATSTLSVHENTTEATNSTIVDSDRYQWPQQLQGLILSSFYWGYILSILPGGVLAKKFGPKIIALIGVFLSAFVTASSPLAVQYGGAYALIVSRILTGFLLGPFEACVATFGVSWFPVEQRGKYCCIYILGSSIGGVVSTYFSSMLIHYTNRWDIVFYYFSVITIVWCILFAFLCYDDPETHPFISDKEKVFLTEKIAAEKEKSEASATPWKAMLTNVPVLILIFSTALSFWGFNVLSTDLPKYLNDVIHLPIQKNGIYSSVSRGSSLFVSLVSVYLNDWLHEGCGMSLTNARKLFGALASLVPAIFLISASYAGCHEVLVAVFITIAVAFHGFNTVSKVLNVYDLGPNYIGPLFGLVNSAATLTAMITPYLVGVLTPNALLSEWRILFWITFVFHLIETSIFTIWGSAKVQPWNTSTPSNKANA